MTSLKILFVTYSFPPLRGAEVAMTMNYVQTLPRMGYQLLVLTGKPALRDLDASSPAELPRGVEVVRAPSLEDFFLSVLARMGVAAEADVMGLSIENPRAARSLGRALLRVAKSLKLLPNHVAGWTPFATQAGRQLIRKAACIVTRSNPVTSHLVGLKLKLMSGLPWIACFSDPWALDPFPAYGGRIYPPGFVHALDRRLESRVVMLADRIVMTTEEQRKLYSANYPEFAEKFAVVPNSYSDQSEALLRELRSRAHTTSHTDHQRFLVVHAGSLFRRRSPEPVLKALGAIRVSHPEVYPRLRVVFLGESSTFAHKSREYGVSDIVEFLPPVTHDDALRYCASADLLLLIDSPSKERGIFLPSKLLDYMIAGKPILAITPEGAAASLVRASRTGDAVTSYEPQDIAAALVRSFFRLTAGNEPFSPNWPEIGRYSASECSRALLNIVASLTRAGTRETPHG